VKDRGFSNNYPIFPHPLCSAVRALVLVWIHRLIREHDTIYSLSYTTL
jgi:hypothetical protein